MSPIAATIVALSFRHPDDEHSAFRLTRGAEIYDIACADCHGKNLEGKPNWQSPSEDGVLPAPPYNDTGHTWHHPDSLSFEYTKFGGEETMRKIGLRDVKSGMSGFSDELTGSWT